MIICYLSVYESATLPITYKQINRACITELMGCLGYVSRLSSLTLSSIQIGWDRFTNSGGATTCFAIIIGS